MEPREVFVVIPAFNEERVLRSTVSGLESRGYSIVVVDDGSTPPARQHLTGVDVFYLRHVTNLGQGAALQTGTEFALSRGAQLIVHFDADGQHSAELIGRLIEPILRGSADAVLGSRFLDPHDRQQVPLKKRMLLRAGIVISWLFTGVRLSDTHNGFRALSRRAAERIVMRENGFAHATEILELIRRSELRWTEVPATVRYTEYSVGKGQSAFNGFNIVIDLVLRKLFN